MRIFVEGANTVEPLCLCQGSPPWSNGCAPDLAIGPPRDRLIIRIMESCLGDNVIDAAPPSLLGHFVKITEQ